MKIYVDENQKYYETKSSAQTLTGVSIAGAILIILVDLDIIPLNIEQHVLQYSWIKKIPNKTNS